MNACYLRPLDDLTDSDRCLSNDHFQNINLNIDGLWLFYLITPKLIYYLIIYRHFILLLITDAITFFSSRVTRPWQLHLGSIRAWENRAAVSGNVELTK